MSTDFLAVLREETTTKGCQTGDDKWLAWGRGGEKEDGGKGEGKGNMCMTERGRDRICGEGNTGKNEG